MTSFWEKESFYNKRDVIIVGSGITGLSTAISIKERKPNLSVTILERGSIPLGASTKNAGFACFGSPGELLADIRLFGEDETFSLVEKRWRGLQLLRNRLGDEKLDYQGTGGYEIFNEKTIGSDEINSLNKSLSMIFENNVFSESNDLIEKFGFNGIGQLISNPFEGVLHPGKMINGLINLASQKNIDVISGVNVDRLEQDDAWKVISDLGTFETEQVVVCTNGFAQTLLPELKVNPARAQVLITKPVVGLKIKGAFHYDEGYYYFRNVGQRLLLGGARNIDVERETTTEINTTSNIIATLKHFASEVILPGIKFEKEMEWAGIMGVGENKKVIVKEIKPGLYCGVRLGGMGVAIGSVVGEELAHLVIR